jgi:hypothetical protein
MKTKSPIYCSRYVFFHPRDIAHRMVVDYNIFPVHDSSEKSSVMLVFKETSSLTPSGKSLSGGDSMTEMTAASPLPPFDGRRRSSFPMDRQQLVSQGDSLRSRSLEKVTILFSDIRGFTTMTESMALEEIVDMLNAYFTEMVEAVFEEYGTLDKVLPSPSPSPSPFFLSFRLFILP